MLALTAMLIVFAPAAFAQSAPTVTGTVTDQSGQPVIGATIIEQGTTNGATTGVDGSYSLKLRGGGNSANLIFQSLGFVSQTVAVNGRTKIDVKLAEDAVALDAVVAIGYGTVKQKDLTTAVSVVKTDDLARRPITSASGALQGKAAGVQVIHARAEDVDGQRRSLRLHTGQELPWDRLVLSPGVDMRWGALEGYDEAAAELAPHAWKAGAQTRLLRRQLEAMPDGGLFVMVIPDNPFRCPPGPYERASLVAHYLQQHKPRSKILLLDAKNNFSKKELFLPAWKTLYGDRIEWVSLAEDGQVVRVDARALEVETLFGTRHRADVLNVIPPQKAGLIAARAGVLDASGWAPVRGENFASKQVAGIHVLGDAIFPAPTMPKSGHMANQHGKVAAAAIVALPAGRAPNALPIYNNTCYSFVSDTDVVHVASVHRYDAEKKTMLTVPGSGGVSAAASELEGRYGMAWARNIWADTLA